MSANVALIVIYNHKYLENIDVIERLYGTKFSSIFHLMPFYDGDRPNVIPVYENSRYFQGYMAQGARHFIRETFSHYLFIADDLLLNPGIDEANCGDYFHTGGNTCFVPELICLHELEPWWPRVADALAYRVRQPFIEADNELPTYDEALRCFEKFGLTVGPLSVAQVWRRPKLGLRTFCSRDQLRKSILFKARQLKSLLTPNRYRLKYPLVGSYADICLVSAPAISRFCHYCGVFAATRLHAEIAVASALVLAADKIVTEEVLPNPGKAMWYEERTTEVSRYNHKLGVLLADFPDNALYLHPIKLSQWDTDMSDGSTNVIAGIATV
jgi:hypothetical protein